MKLLHAAALAITPILALSANPALADGHAEAAAETAPAALTIDSSIEVLMANEATKAVVTKHLGQLDQHPAYGQFKGMTLVQLKPLSGGQITDEALENIKTELAALS